jgi:hypothetical protein
LGCAQGAHRAYACQATGVGSGLAGCQASLHRTSARDLTRRGNGVHERGAMTHEAEPTGAACLRPSSGCIILRVPRESGESTGTRRGRTCFRRSRANLRRIPRRPRRIAGLVSARLYKRLCSCRPGIHTATSPPAGNLPARSARKLSPLVPWVEGAPMRGWLWPWCWLSPVAPWVSASAGQHGLEAAADDDDQHDHGIRA